MLLEDSNPYQLTPIIRTGDPVWSTIWLPLVAKYLKGGVLDAWHPATGFMEGCNEGGVIVGRDDFGGERLFVGPWEETLDGKIVGEREDFTVEGILEGE